MSAQTTVKRSPLQLAAGLFGATFLLVGILGFVPGITSGIEHLGFAGHHSEAMLLGVFQISTLHNLVHLIFGVLGLVAATAAPRSKMFLVLSGAVYLVLWIYGLAAGSGPANFIPLNMADNWLHFILGTVMLLSGLLLGRKATRH
ncbi:DUF4383 domain-containing protein [Glutamicibacter sp. X7]